MQESFEKSLIESGWKVLQWRSSRSKAAKHGGSLTARNAGMLDDGAGPTSSDGASPAARRDGPEAPAVQGSDGHSTAQSIQYVGDFADEEVDSDDERGEWCPPVSEGPSFVVLRGYSADSESTVKERLRPYSLKFFEAYHQNMMADGFRWAILVSFAQGPTSIDERFGVENVSLRVKSISDHVSCYIFHFLFANKSECCLV